LLGSRRRSLSEIRRIGIVGGTGPLGKGLAARLSYTYEVLIGSRGEAKAEGAAEEVRGLTGRKVRGATNLEAARACDSAILALPDLAASELIEEMKNELGGKLVISPIVPMRIEDGLFTYSPGDASAAESVASILDRSRVAAAFHTVPAPKLLAIGEKLEYTVPVAAETREKFKEVATLVSSIQDLKPLYAGPLSSARTIEALTPLLLNIGRLNGRRNPSIRII
jgi:8-hydroxy-5-deazaflavin:NADPH oxidoreductase